MVASIECCDPCLLPPYSRLLIPPPLSVGQLHAPPRHRSYSSRSSPHSFVRVSNTYSFTTPAASSQVYELPLGGGTRMSSRCLRKSCSVVASVDTFFPLACAHTCFIIIIIYYSSLDQHYFIFLKYKFIFF